MSCDAIAYIWSSTEVLNLVLGVYRSSLEFYSNSRASLEAQIPSGSCVYR